MELNGDIFMHQLASHEQGGKFAMKHVDRSGSDGNSTLRNVGIFHGRFNGDTSSTRLLMFVMFACVCVSENGVWPHTINSHQITWGSSEVLLLF